MPTSSEGSANKRARSPFPANTPFTGFAKCAFAWLQTLDDDAVIIRIEKSKIGAPMLWISTTTSKCPVYGQAHQGNHIYFRVNLLELTIQLGCWNDSCGGAVGTPLMYNLPLESARHIDALQACATMGDWWKQIAPRLGDNYDPAAFEVFPFPVHFSTPNSRRSSDVGSNSGSQADEEVKSSKRQPPHSSPAATGDMEYMALGYTEDWHYNAMCARLDQHEHATDALCFLLKRLAVPMEEFKGTQQRKYLRQAQRLWHPDHNMQECAAVRGERRAWFVWLQRCIEQDA